MYHSPQSTTLPKINTCSHCNVIPIWFYTVNNLSLANSYNCLNPLYSAFAPVSVCVPVYVRSPTPIYIEWSGMGEEIADSSTQGEDSVFQGIGQNKTNTLQKISCWYWHSRLESTIRLVGEMFPPIKQSQFTDNHQLRRWESQWSFVPRRDFDHT